MNFESDKPHNITEAVIYARVSSKSQLKRGDGVNSQMTRCRQYAEYRGYTIVDTFSDDLTGKRSDRAGLQALIERLKTDKSKRYVVLIDDVSRFARRVDVHFGLKEQIVAAGGVLESPSMVFRDDADGELHEYIVTSVAQHQARKNAEQTENRRKSRCYNGYWPFAAPLGYRHEKVEGHNGKLMVRDEPVASILKEGLEGFASGRLATQAELKRYFESQPDFPKDLPNGEIRSQRITDILRRVVYAGYIDAPYYAISMVKAKHEALVSLETFHRIQDILDGKKRPGTRKDLNADFVLRGHVVCGDCDKPLTAAYSKSKTGKRHAYYECFNRCCNSYRKTIRRADIEGEFSSLLRQLRPSKSLFRIAKAMFKDAWQQRAEQDSAMKLSLKRDLKTLDAKVERLVDQIAETESTTVANAYERKIIKLEKEKCLALEKLERGGEPVRSFEELFELAMRFLSNPWILWDFDRLEDKKTLLKLVFPNRLSYCRKSGFRTPDLPLPFKYLGCQNMIACKMARWGGIELVFLGVSSHPLSQ